MKSIEYWVQRRVYTKKKGQFPDFSVAWMLFFRKIAFGRFCGPLQGPHRAVGILNVGPQPSCVIDFHVDAFYLGVCRLARDPIIITPQRGNKLFTVENAVLLLHSCLVASCQS